jgi:hypothetical protein
VVINTAINLATQLKNAANENEMKKKLNQTPSSKPLHTPQGMNHQRIQDDATNAMRLATLQAHVPTNLHHHNNHIKLQLTNAYLACQQKQKTTQITNQRK